MARDCQPDGKAREVIEVDNEFIVLTQDEIDSFTQPEDDDCVLSVTDATLDEVDAELEEP
jgi:hypothetical protein